MKIKLEFFSDVCYVQMSTIDSIPIESKIHSNSVYLTTYMKKKAISYFLQNLTQLPKCMKINFFLSSPSLSGTLPKLNGPDILMFVKLSY